MDFLPRVPLALRTFMRSADPASAEAHSGSDQGEPVSALRSHDHACTTAALSPARDLPLTGTSTTQTFYGAPCGRHEIYRKNGGPFDVVAGTLFFCRLQRLRKYPRGRPAYLYATLLRLILP